MQKFHRSRFSNTDTIEKQHMHEVNKPKQKINYNFDSIQYLWLQTGFETQNFCIVLVNPGPHVIGVNNKLILYSFIFVVAEYCLQNPTRNMNYELKRLIFVRKDKKNDLK